MKNLKNSIIGLIKSILKPLTKNFVYTYKFSKTEIKLKGGLGLARIRNKPSKEEVFIESLDYSGKVVYDIGGYIGIFSVVIGKKVGSEGKVFCFEPNPELYQRILANLELNKLSNVQLFNIGISNEKKTETLVIRKGLAATGSMEESIQADILKEKGVKSIQVEINALDKLISENELPKPDFIKIDIEGMEYPALLGMNKTLASAKPELYIEIHGANDQKKTENIQRVVEYLIGHGYTIKHIESDTIIDSDNSPVAKEGHIFCT